MIFYCSNHASKLRVFKIATRKTKVLLAVGMLLLSACSAKPHVINHTDITVTSPMEIAIVNHGWHTGFVIPSDTIQQVLPELQERFKNIPYIEFGWGDMAFYQAEEITLGLTVQAILWPTESVIHAVAIPKRASEYYTDRNVRNICLNQEQYAHLISFIESSFYKDGKGNIVKLKKGIYGNSQFYKGEGDYYLMNTCNKWSAKGLKSAGFDISPTFKLSASSIIDYLDKHDTALTNHLCTSGTNNRPDIID